MKRMRGIFAAVGLALGLVSALCAGGAAAAESDFELEPMRPNLEDKPSLQRGMALYMNYCAGCHSLKFQRYERTADDLGIPHRIALDNLVFTGSPIGSLIETAMPPESARNWFGAPPPDLTMVDRVRGTAWVYNMLKNFYADPQRPFGVNNRVFENIGMPHALMPLQGVPQVACKGSKPIDILDGARLLAGTPSERIFEGSFGHDRPREENCNFIEAESGTGAMSAEEFDQAAYDIANFLHYVGEPGRLERQRIGYWVLGFLALLFVLATLLNREYWKDIH